MGQSLGVSHGTASQERHGGTNGTLGTRGKSRTAAGMSCSSSSTPQI
jgi:hypothetical protein